jgi:hypothetical protein
MLPLQLGYPDRGDHQKAMQSTCVSYQSIHYKLKQLWQPAYLTRTSGEFRNSNCSVTKIIAALLPNLIFMSRTCGLYYTYIMITL